MKLRYQKWKKLRQEKENGKKFGRRHIFQNHLFFVFFLYKILGAKCWNRDEWKTSIGNIQLKRDIKGEKKPRELENLLVRDWKGEMTNDENTPENESHFSAINKLLVGLTMIWSLLSVESVHISLDSVSSSCDGA